MSPQPWDRSIGPKGATVRVKEDVVGGEAAMYTTHPSGTGYSREPLGFRVRDAEGQLVAELTKAALQEAARTSNLILQGERPIGGLTLGELFDHFRRHELPHKSERRQAELERAMEALENFFGRHFRVDRLSRSDWEAFSRARQSGAIGSDGLPVENPDDRRDVSPTTAGYDLTALRQVFRWAEGFRLPNGDFLLDKDPTRGLTLPSNPNPKQPVYDDAECDALLKVADQVLVGHGDEKQKTALQVLLIVAMETGRRIGAILALRWSDWYPDGATHGVLRWRAEEDKIGREWKAPVTERVREAIKEWRREHPGVGEAWMFPAPESEGHVRGDVALGWLRRAEKLAEGVEYVKGRGWHGFRRRWASKRKHLPATDVAYAGGWKDTQTLQRCYQQPDPETVESVVLAERPFRRGANS